MSGPVLAFDMNATRGAKLARIVPEQIEVPSDEVANTPAPVAGNRFSERAAARADVSSVYASFLGVDLQKTDVLERLAADSDDELSSESIAKALSAVGLVTVVNKVRHPKAADWPALAEMTSGQVVLVLEQAGDTLTVYDTTCRDNRAEVSMAEFLLVFAGRVIDK